MQCTVGSILIWIPTIYQRSTQLQKKSSIFYNPIAVLAKYADSFPVSVEDPGCLSRIPIFSIPDPGSRVKKTPRSASASKNLSILIQKIVSKLSEI
jgi:hypothetical protein